MPILRGRRNDGDARRFRMREKLASIGEDFWIEDEDGNRVFKVDGKALRVRDTFVMEDSWPGATAGLAAGMTTIFWPESPQPGPEGALVAHSAADVRAYLGLN